GNGRDGFCGIDDALELDIKRAVVGFDSSTDRNVALVVSDPDRKLTLLVIDESIWPKELRIHVKHINFAKDRLHAFFRDHFHRDRVDASAVADKDIESFSYFELLGTNEIDCG